MRSKSAPTHSADTRPGGESARSGAANRLRVLEYLRTQRVSSCPRLARQTGLSRTTVGAILDELLRLGIAEQTGLADSSGGRRAVLLRYKPDAAYAVGASLAPGQWRTVLTDLDARVLNVASTRVLDDSPAACVAALGESLVAVAASVDRGRLLSVIGIGTPGVVDTLNGVVKSAVDVGWNDVPLARMVQDRLGLRAVVANRSRVAALAELSDGAGREVQDMIYVSISTSISAGIVYRRQLYLGANSAAGELGHMTVLPDGPLCPCGNRGCLEQLAAGPAIAQLARARLKQGGDSPLASVAGAHPEQLTAEDIFRVAAQGDALAIGVVQTVAGYLGIAVANLVNLFNPELIVLGGPVGRAAPNLLAPLTEEVRRRAMGYPFSAVRIVTSQMGPYAPAIGAAALVLQQSSQIILAGPTARLGASPRGDTARAPAGAYDRD